MSPTSDANPKLSLRPVPSWGLSQGERVAASSPEGGLTGDLTVKPRYIAVDPDDKVVFCGRTQSVYFSSIKQAKREVRAELEEPSSDDGEREYTVGEDEGWDASDYRIFVEVKG